MSEQPGYLCITSLVWLAVHTTLLPGELCQSVSVMGEGDVVVVSGGMVGGVVVVGDVVVGGAVVVVVDVVVVGGGVVVIGAMVVVGIVVVVVFVVVETVVVVSPCSYSGGDCPVLQLTNNSINTNPNTAEVALDNVALNIAIFMQSTPYFYFGFLKNTIFRHNCQC